MDFAGTDQTKDKRQLEEIFVLSNSSGNGLLSIPELQGVLDLMGKRCQQHEALSMVAGTPPVSWYWNVAAREPPARRTALQSKLLPGLSSLKMLPVLLIPFMAAAH